MFPDSATLKRIIRAVAMTRDEEIGCDDCFAELDRFVEIELAGRSPAEALPLVSAHLERCKSCREEYEALRDILQRGL